MAKNRLEHYRTGMGWTQEDLARILDVSVSTLRNWEKGRYEPSMRASWKLQDTLGVSARTIFSWPEDAHAQDEDGGKKK